AGARERRYRAALDAALDRLCRWQRACVRGLDTHAVQVVREDDCAARGPARPTFRDLQRDPGTRHGVWNVDLVVGDVARRALLLRSRIERLRRTRRAGRGPAAGDERGGREHGGDDDRIAHERDSRNPDPTWGPRKVNARSKLRRAAARAVRWAEWERRSCSSRTI